MSDTQAAGGSTLRDERVDEDARQLEALGYKSHFSRTMSLAANFSLGFTYLSPLVGVYTLFAFVVATGGAAGRVRVGEVLHEAAGYGRTEDGFAARDGSYGTQDLGPEGAF